MIVDRIRLQMNVELDQSLDQKNPLMTVLNSKIHELLPLETLLQITIIPSPVLH